MKLIESTDPYMIAWEDKNGIRHEKPITRRTPFDGILTRSASRVNYYHALVLTRDPYLALNLAYAGTVPDFGGLPYVDESYLQRTLALWCKGSGVVILRPASMDRKIRLSWEWTPEALHIRCHCGQILDLQDYFIHASTYNSARMGVVSPCVICVDCNGHFFPMLWNWKGPDKVFPLLS